QEDGGEDDLAFASGEVAKALGAEKAPAGHLGVDTHISLGVVGRVLGAAVQRVHPIVVAAKLAPVELPVGGLGAALEDVHSRLPAAGRKMSTGLASWLGTMGRSSQWLPESMTAVRKLPRTSL